MPVANSAWGQKFYLLHPDIKLGDRDKWSAVFDGDKQKVYCAACFETHVAELQVSDQNEVDAGLCPEGVQERHQIGVECMSYFSSHTDSILKYYSVVNKKEGKKGHYGWLQSVGTAVNNHLHNCELADADIQNTVREESMCLVNTGSSGHCHPPSAVNTHTPPQCVILSVSTHHQFLISPPDLAKCTSISEPPFLPFNPQDQTWT